MAQASENILSAATLLNEISVDAAELTSRYKDMMSSLRLAVHDATECTLEHLLLYDAAAEELQVYFRMHFEALITAIFDPDSESLGQTLGSRPCLTCLLILALSLHTNIQVLSAVLQYSTEFLALL